MLPDNRAAAVAAAVAPSPPLSYKLSPRFCHKSDECRSLSDFFAEAKRSTSLYVVRSTFPTTHLGGGGHFTQTYV